MTVNLVPYFKKICSLILNILGWCILANIWYQMAFSSNGFPSTLKAFQMIALWAAAVFILCFTWDKFNLDSLSFHNEFSSKYIRMKIPYWTWSIAVLYVNNTISTIERSEIICRQKANFLSPSRRFSYAAILIRDGHIKEAVGFLRPMLHDPKIGQLTCKIAKSELEVLLSEKMHFYK